MNRTKLVKVLLAVLIYLLVILLFGILVIVGKIELDVYLIGKCGLVLAIIAVVQVTGVYKKIRRRK